MISDIGITEIIITLTEFAVRIVVAVRLVITILLII